MHPKMAGRQPIKEADRMRFCVVGGLNLDIIGTGEQVLKGDSNIGSIHFSAGGVGHNIARILRQSGQEAALITVLSRDLFGEYLQQECKKEELDTSASLVTELRSSAYMAAHTPDGELLYAVNDMPALRLLDRREILARANYLNSFDAIVTEANLGEDALKALTEIASVPVIADAVSANKCKRLEAILPYLSALKLNLLEAQTMTGENSPKDAGQALLHRGVRCVLVSLGSEGVYVCGKDEDAFLKPGMRYTCQTNGAGDAMCAGLAEATALGLDAVKSAGKGMEYAERLLRNRQTKNEV